MEEKNKETNQVDREYNHKTDDEWELGIVYIIVSIILILFGCSTLAKGYTYDMGQDKSELGTVVNIFVAPIVAIGSGLVNIFKLAIGFIGGYTFGIFAIVKLTDKFCKSTLGIVCGWIIGFIGYIVVTGLCIYFIK